MARPSAADRGSPTVPGERPPPPPDLDLVEAALWRRIAASVSPTFLDVTAQLLLKEHVRHLSYAQDLATDIAQTRALIDQLAGELRETPNGAARLDLLKALEAARAALSASLRAHTAQVRAAASLATKMRLTAQARVPADAAGANIRKSTSGMTPWSDWSADAPADLAAADSKRN